MGLEVRSSHRSALAPARKTLRVCRSEYLASSVPLAVRRRKCGVQGHEQESQSQSHSRLAA
jgi:hypothetical protein